MCEFLAAHWLDIVTTILGLAYILLEYRVSLWMWAVGFLMQTLGIVLYYQKGLYADCGMEFYYLAMTFYGWWRWMRKAPQPLPVKEESKCSQGGLSAEEAPIPHREEQEKGSQGAGIRHFPRRLVLPWLLIIAAIWAFIYWLLVTFTNSNVPLADSFTTALSIVGIWALAHKYLEQWFIWIAVDVVTCVLYFFKDIPFKAGLYALYVVIAVLGYRKWRKLMVGKQM